MDRIKYFGYVVLTSIRHSRKLYKYSLFYAKKHDRCFLYFLLNAYRYYLKYNMHPLDYFYYNVYENPDFSPTSHANTLFMYQFHKKLNSKSHIKYFHNKVLFNQKFREFMGHDFLDLKRASREEIKNWILKRMPTRLIVKRCKSVGGFGVKKIDIDYRDGEIYCNGIPFARAIKWLKTFDLVEEFVNQHPSMDKLNPSCLNTVRVVTVKTEDRVDILAAILRLGVNSDVDNFHSGGIAINVNLSTGCLSGSGFKLAPSVPDSFDEHPVTKIKLDGFSLPNWDLVLETVKKACFVVPEVRTVGWDVAITENGVSLIEGNHDWDKIIVEKALKRPIKSDLEKYLH